jgi:hypothetical protein
MCGCICTCTRHSAELYTASTSDKHNTGCSCEVPEQTSMACHSVTHKLGKLVYLQALHGLDWGVTSTGPQPMLMAVSIPYGG